MSKASLMTKEKNKTKGLGDGQANVISGFGAPGFNGDK